MTVPIRDQLLSAVDGRRGIDAADRLCETCVALFDVDAAAISLVFDGATNGTLGCSDEQARAYDEVQFTVGEGPCLESVALGAPVLVTDLADRTERIQSAMDESETKLAEATTEAAEIRSAAGDIDAERQRLFAEADTEAESILTEGRARLDEEIEELRAAADSDIALIASRASGEIRGEISMLSRRAVDRAVAGQPLDDATQQELIESFISKVGAS